MAPMRLPETALALLLALASAAPAEDPAPKAPVKEVPVDAGLEPERDILKEARSDPRNLKYDAIPLLRNPAYTGVLDAKRMDPEEWVIGTVIGGKPLAFPINVLNHHEIVLDTADGVPFLVCFCPLCRTGMVFARALDGETLEFGHSGMLYRSAFLLYDLGTKSLWHHATGRALTGKLRGRRLEPIASRFVTWGTWRKAYPDSKVLAKDPMKGDYVADAFDHRNRALRLKFGLGILCGEETRLYELTELDRMPLVQETVGGEPVVVSYHPASKTATAWRRTLEGKVLDLRRAEDGENGLPRLEETGEKGSIFDAVTGFCVSGPLQGKSLKPVIGCFWEVHAWIAHHPLGTMFRASAPPPVDLPDVPR